jgi:hypothetical protein
VTGTPGWLRGTVTKGMRIAAPFHMPAPKSGCIVFVVPIVET